MDGKTVVRIVETILAERRISRGDFYAQSGISSATFSQWRTGQYDPSQDKIAQIEKCLGVTLADYEKSDPRETLRDDLRVLLNSASDLPPSSVYALISQIEKMKEDAT
ncbi:MAG: helix-turn-helix transcriptional regulator [Paludibacteraceae bacterium]|nr:helix-turn-helix transcriptional regulator [Paludibacteraceae bacterium]